jgi:hypothetical protein
LNFFSSLLTAGSAIAASTKETKKSNTNGLISRNTMTAKEILIA